MMKISNNALVGVVEWQTRQTQNLVRIKPREGSTPSSDKKFFIKFLRIKFKNEVYDIKKKFLLHSYS